MDMSVQSAAITLQPGTVLRMRHTSPRHISLVSGILWLTRDGDRRDVVLESGDDLVLEQSGTVTLQALRGAAVVVLEEGVEPQRPRPEQPSFVKRLTARLARGLEGARTRAQLHALSDRTLADIGVQRMEIDCLVR